MENKDTLKKTVLLQKKIVRIFFVCFFIRLNDLNLLIFNKFFLLFLLHFFVGLSSFSFFWVACYAMQLLSFDHHPSIHQSINAHSLLKRKASGLCCPRNFRSKKSYTLNSLFCESSADSIVRVNRGEISLLYVALL